MTTISVTLDSDQLAGSALQEMARNLNADLARHTDASSELKTGQAQANHKGEPITLGVLLITFMASGTAVAVINLLKSYLNRDRSLSLTVELPEGRKVLVKATNAADIEELSKLLVTATPE